jgi:GLPGLI family protein
MRKFSALFIFIASAITFSFTTSDFEGKINFEISVSGGNMPPEAQAMFAGSELNVFIKGTKSRSEMTMGFQSTVNITDRKANTSVALMDVMGNKYMIKTDNSKDKEKMSDAVVKELDETKTIAGYKCKKAEITFKDKSGKEQTTTVFYSEDIANQMGFDKRNYQFKGIKGMPLEYEVKSENGMTMKMTAKSVTKENVSDDKFVIPSGYKETTMEEMQKEIMKKMGQQ